MYQLPPMPEWSNLHPLLTHFPLVLFLLLPILLILAGLSRGARNHTFWVASLVTMLAALGFLGVTFFSGAAFANATQKLPTDAAVLSQHCTLAQYCIGAFGVAAILLVIALVLRRSLKLEDMRELTPWIPIGFFAFYGFGVFLASLDRASGGHVRTPVVTRCTAVTALKDCRCFEIGCVALFTDAGSFCSWDGASSYSAFLACSCRCCKAYSFY